jgi:uridine kinase
MFLADYKIILINYWIHSFSSWYYLVKKNCKIRIFLEDDKDYKIIYSVRKDLNEKKISLIMNIEGL